MIKNLFRSINSVCLRLQILLNSLSLTRSRQSVPPPALLDYESFAEVSLALQFIACFVAFFSLEPGFHEHPNILAIWWIGAACSTFVGVVNLVQNAIVYRYLNKHDPPSGETQKHLQRYKAVQSLNFWEAFGLVTAFALALQKI